MISILGSGFGLYGHLPALVELGHEVALPARYRLEFEGRAELATHASGVRFVEEASLLQIGRAAVLARRPADNEALAYQASRDRGPRLLVIEKPPAPTPTAARALAGALAKAGIRHVVPYLLTHCDWAHEAQRALRIGQAGDVRLDWRFHSPTVTAGSWKASNDDGGGPLNYYFIHVIALAVFLLGEDLVLEDSWRRSVGTGVEIGMCATSGGRRFAASFSLDPAASACTVTLDGSPILSAETPFGPTPRRGERDPRVDILKRFYTTAVFSPPERSDAIREARIVDLWAEMS